MLIPNTGTVPIDCASSTVSSHSLKSLTKLQQLTLALRTALPIFL